MFRKNLAPLFIRPFPIKKWSIRDDTLGSWIKKLPKCPVFVVTGIPISGTLSASVWRRLASPVVCSSWRSRQALHVVAGEPCGKTWRRLGMGPPFCGTIYRGLSINRGQKDSEMPRTPKKKRRQVWQPQDMRSWKPGSEVVVKIIINILKQQQCVLYFFIIPL